ncbi:phytanoyl-CoA dioxygenase family protein [Aestuariivirga sp.]|uniref:phytanoyl-CoA dioxygenase family protein n=1 Tax=Aestuariivirga sp. TaxID=2650926 RepID=UPI00359348DA
MLTREQIESFNENGYLVIEDVIDEVEVIEPIRREYAVLMDELYDGWHREGRLKAPPHGMGFHDKLLAAHKAGCDWFQPMDISLPGDRISSNSPMHFGPAVFDLLRNRRLLDVVESLIGPEITSNPIQHVRIKPPSAVVAADEARGHVTVTDWHQDRGVHHEDADHTSMVTVWCAISDATLDNGCMVVVPGAHRAGMLPHCPKRQTSIADGLIDESQAVPLTVRSGGMIVFHPLVPHASRANLTDGFRWSFDIRYNRTGEPTGRAHFPAFVARSRANPASELKDWRKWLSMWEQARATLAVQPHIANHRWTSDAPACA